ncbi:hypothetical protein [Agromyces sp. SYSU T00194]|uniref:hypothetical protein n=1 Tax=Agromyces chitinivorans TaxID=3158560 RepID=UPI0033938308
MIRVALRALPSEFRAEYGDEVLLVSRDTLREASASGPAALSSARGRILIDLVATAAAEHVRKGFTMRTTAPGIGYGIAAAIGFPLYIASYGSYGFWNVVDGVHGLFGVNPALWFHPLIAAIGGVLAAIGLFGLVGRLGLTARTRAIARSAAILAGLALVVTSLGILDDGAILRNSVHRLLDTIEAIGWFVGFGGTIVMLIACGVVAVRRRALGVWSAAPLVAGVGVAAWVSFVLVGMGAGWGWENLLAGPVSQLLLLASVLACVATGVGIALAPRHRTDPADHAPHPKARIDSAATA